MNDKKTIKVKTATHNKMKRLLTTKRIKDRGIKHIYQLVDVAVKTLEKGDKNDG